MANNEQSTKKQFDPAEHLIQLKSKQGSQDYLPVQWRIAWFRSECPHGTIDTEEVEVDLDRVIEAEAFVWNAEKRRSEKVTKQAKGYARFRCTVTDGKGGRATGTGSEAAADFADFVEKSETKAVGRALAALGYGTQFAPELQEGVRLADAPVDRVPVQNNDDGSGRGEGADVRPEPLPNNRDTPPASTGNEADTAATPQQIASIGKLCEYLDKEIPNVTTFLAAKRVIQGLNAECKERRQGSKAS